MAFDTTALAEWIKENPELLFKTQGTSGLADIATIQSGIKGKERLNYFDTAVTFGDGGCTVTYTDTTVFSQRLISVEDIGIGEKLCIKDLDTKWTQMLIKQGKEGYEEIPFEQQWLESKMNKLALAITTADFQGDILGGAGNNSKYDGLLKIVADAGASVVDGTNGVTLVDKTNIIDVIEYMWSVVPEEISDRNDFVLMMPYAYYKLYTTALKEANLYHFIGEDGMTKFYGTDLTLMPTVGLSGVNDMILTYGENIVIGMDGESDEEKFDLRPDVTAGVRQTVLFETVFKRGVQVVFPDRIVKFHF